MKKFFYTTFSFPNTWKTRHNGERPNKIINELHFLILKTFTINFFETKKTPEILGFILQTHDLTSCVNNKALYCSIRLYLYHKSHKNTRHANTHTGILPSDN